MSTVVQLSVSTIGGQSFDLDVKQSSHGFNIKQMLVEKMRAAQVTMCDGSDWRVSAMRLLCGTRIVEDHAPISCTTSDSNALITLVPRPPECEQFLLQPISLRDACDIVRQTKECVLAQVRIRPQDLEHVINWCNDKEVVLAAVENEGDALQYAAEHLQDDREVVLTAVENSEYALQHASEQLQNDKHIVLAAVEKGGYALEYAGEELQNDKDVVLAAVRNNGDALQYAGDQLRDDEDVVWVAVSNDGDALEFAGKQFQDNKEVVLTAVRKSAYALRHASQQLRDDREVVLAAVEKGGDDAVRYAGKVLQDDIDVVLKAMEVEDWKRWCWKYGF